MKKTEIPEIIALGIYNAQLAIKNKAVSSNRKTTMFEIELPIGEGGTSYIDDSSHKIGENVIICAKPGQMRHTRLPFKCYYVHIMVSEGAVYDILTSLPNYIETDDCTAIRDTFNSLCKHYSVGTPEENLMLESLVLKLVYLMNKHAQKCLRPTHLQKRNNQAAIKDTLDYIQKNPAADLGLDELSKRVNFTPIYFHKLFKASTGKTLRDYVEEQRIKYAVKLMVSSEKSVTDIAYECGFSSQSYFSYAFKRRMGVSPRKYLCDLQMKYERMT